MGKSSTGKSCIRVEQRDTRGNSTCFKAVAVVLRTGSTRGRGLSPLGLANSYDDTTNVSGGSKKAVNTKDLTIS